MEKIFVDSSAFIAFFFGNDENHKEAYTLFQKLKNSKTSLYTSDYIIDETLTTLLSRSGHKQSVAAGEAIFSSHVIEIITVCPDYLKPSWELYQKYDDKKFSFTDVTSFAIIKGLNIKKAFSFDSDFTKVGIELIN
ncbi:MAG: PIN domain-containing protein [Candidatus Omnitrophica bacterium]|nr:PIN domain-containing protein [Candidatus Omnitrophota bacterium]